MKRAVAYMNIFSLSKAQIDSPALQVERAWRAAYDLERSRIYYRLMRAPSI